MEKRARLAQHRSRRDALKYGGLALLPFAISPASFALPDQQLTTANGGTEPYPIPWLDKNGSHNQPAGPTLTLRISTISKAESRGAAPLQASAQTIMEIASRSAAPQLTTARCKGNTGLLERRSKVSSRIYD